MRVGFVAGVVAAALGFFVQDAVAAGVPTGLVVARSNACLGCHTVDRKLVGPSFRQIAEKYKGDPQAVAKLSKKVRDGGSGVWGVIPMPSHPRMKDEEIQTVVKWVLAGAPEGAK